MENKWFLKGGRGSGKTIRVLCEVYGNRITELEKENAELVKTAETFQTTTCKLSVQLTNAKEHIRTLISCLIDWVQEGDKDYCYIADAEQFLEEIEK